jgi:hypothetical protein
VAKLVGAYLSTQEWEDTAEVIRQLRPARERGYLTAAELEVVCRWKSPRAIRYIRSNSAADIRNATRKALATRSERRRLDALTSLNGVSVPMASAALTLVEPRRYGVIDIRVWQMLHALGAVTKNRAGVGFNFSHWREFLTILRHFAARHRVKARDVERALFLAHKDRQKGTLY